MGRMNKEPLRSKKIEEKKKQKRKYAIIIVVLIVLLIVLVYIGNRRKNITYSSYNITMNAEWNPSTNSKCAKYKNGVIKYNRDGAEAISLDGSYLWNVSYNMNDPIIDVCGSYAVIADRGNKDLVIVDDSGGRNDLTLLHNITMISISKNGFTAVMTDNGMENILCLYKPNSVDQDDMIADSKTSLLGSGFPIDMAISPDGKKTATIFLRVEDDDISTWVTFRNFGTVGMNDTSDMVGSYGDFEGSFLAKTYFVSDDTALLMKDDGFVSYSIPERPSEVARVTLESEKSKEEKSKDEILQVAYSEQMICFVTKNSAGEEKYKIQCYNFLGKLISDFTMQDRYENVMTSGDDIVFYSKTSFVIYDKKGTVKIRGDFDKNIDNIYPINNKDKYLLVGDGYLETLRLSE